MEDPVWVSVLHLCGKSVWVVSVVQCELWYLCRVIVEAMWASILSFFEFCIGFVWSQFWIAFFTDCLSSVFCIFVWILLEFCVGFLLELNMKTNWFIIINQTWISISCNLQVLISQKLHIKALDLLVKDWDIFDFFLTHLNHFTDYQMKSIREDLEW